MSSLSKEFEGAADLQARIEVAKAHPSKIAELRAANRQHRLETLAIAASKQRVDKEIADVKALPPVEQPPPPPLPEPVKKFGEFIKNRAATQQTLLQFHGAFKYGEGLLDSELRACALDALFKRCEEWAEPERPSTTLKSIDDLAAVAKNLQADGADVHDTTELRTLYDDIVAMYKANGSRWHREMTRRRMRPKMLSEFDTDRTKLLQWCRQQVASLSNVTEPNHVQEFCASFYNNTAVMESNFLVLMEMSEALLPSSEIEGQLMELAEVWLGLEMQAYEKLRSTLLDLHAKSGLEAQARLWPDFADRFGPFLADAQRILNAPTDEESKSVAAPLKDAAKDLQTNAEPHRLIVAHLSDFTLREECLKEHYNAIHKAAFSKLTLLTQAFPGLYTYPRKTEYTDRMAELSEWVEAKSRSQAWKDLLARVDRMKRIIEENENTLTSAEERY